MGRRLDDNQGLSASTDGMLLTLYISLVLFVIMMLCWEIFRFMKQLYLKRMKKRFQKTDRVPPYPPRHFSGWLYAISKITEEELLLKVGLDAFMCLRYIVICFKASIFFSFWGCVVLAPVYGGAGNAQTGWNQFTLSNIFNGPPEIKSRLWMTVLFGYVFAAYSCYLFYIEYSNFALKRTMSRSIQGDSDTPSQTNYSVIVENIPQLLRSANALRKFLERIFPGDIYHVEMVLDLNQLHKAVVERRNAVDKLEKAVAYQIVSGTTSMSRIWERFGFGLYDYSDRPTIEHYKQRMEVLNSEICELQKIYLSKMDDHDSTTNRTRRRDSDATRFAAASTKFQEVIRENSNTQTTKGSLIQMDQVMKDLNKLKDIFGIKDGNSISSVSSGGSGKDVTVSAGPPPVVNISNSTKINVPLATITEDDLENGMDSPNASRQASTDEQFAEDDEALSGNGHAHTTESLSSETKASANGQVAASSTSGSGGTRARAASTLRQQELEMEAEVERLQQMRREFGVDLDGNKVYCDDAIDGALDGMAGGGGHDAENPMHAAGGDSSEYTNDTGHGPKFALLTNFMDDVNSHAQVIRAGMEGMTKESMAAASYASKGVARGMIEMEKHLELITLGAYFKASSTAFVTFNSRTSRTIAHQVLLSHDMMTIRPAPDPKDIIWDNVITPNSQIRVRHLVANGLMILGACFWSSVVTFIYQASTVSASSSVNQGIAVCVLVLLLALLPLVFDFVCRYYEGFKLESDIQNIIMARYFYYQLANIYVTVTFGSLDILQQIVAMITNPGIIVDLLGTSLPGVSLYFANLIIVKAFIALPLELLRPWPLAYMLGVRLFKKPEACTRRELRTGAFEDPPMLYGWIYPNLMMVQMIIATYCTIAPLLMPFSVIFFGFAYLMYKYQLLYTYINDYQSGGVMWHAVFARTMVSLVFAAFTLLGYLSLQLRDAVFAGPFYAVFPLPWSLLYFWYYCDRRFRNPSTNLTLEFAKEIDNRNQDLQEQGRPTPHSSFTENLYRQPSLRVGKVIPEPYGRPIPPGSDTLPAVAEAIAVTTSSVAAPGLGDYIDKDNVIDDDDEDYEFFY